MRTMYSTPTTTYYNRFQLWQKRLRTPKQPKVKEPVRIRYKTLSDGSQSVYFDIYRDGKRQYEFLKLYLIPETSAAAKAQNKATLAAVNTIKSQRIIELTNSVAGLKNTSQRSKILLLDWMQTYKESQEKKACAEVESSSATR